MATNFDGQRLGIDYYIPNVAYCEGCGLVEPNHITSTCPYTPPKPCWYCGEYHGDNQFCATDADGTSDYYAMLRKGLEEEEPAPHYEDFDTDPS